MKIAIFQNFLDTIGGAEVVGLTMARELHADIYTTNIDADKIRHMGFEDVLPRIHSIGKVPINAPYRQQMTLWRFARLNLEKTNPKQYDFYIINGDWAVSSAAKHSPNLWYVNATIREIWDLHNYVRNTLVVSWQRPIFDIWTTYNRYLNKKHVKNINIIISNSIFTKERVEKYLERESEIIYPPIQTKKFQKKPAQEKPKMNGEYWLSVNRLIAYKRVDMQLRAFAKMPDKKLIILGPYEKSKHCKEYADFIYTTKTPNVTVIDGADNFDDLVNYYRNCVGFITTCHHEDFGMTAVEAMASGKPVIAPNEGGYRETVINREEKNGGTGILIDDIDEYKLIDAVRKLDTKLRNPECRELYDRNCHEQTRKFDVSIFIEKIKQHITHDRIRATSLGSNS